MIVVRREKPEDIEGIRKVNECAFEQPQEAHIVDALRNRCSDILSLVAVEGNRIVGYILFSPATIQTHDGEVGGMGLAPIAVLPDYQGQGIGSKLVRAGLEVLKESSCPFVVVLGHPEYYPRFGFVPASKHGLKCQWEGVPDEAFMTLILDESAMKNVSGIARYRSEFDAAM
jgi:putative acetyltransferase